MAASYAAWDHVGSLMDANPTSNPKVQISRLYRGRDDHNKEILTPIYAHFAEEIEKHLAAEESISARCVMHNGEDRISEVRERDAKRRAFLLDDLNAQLAERQRIEDECGITAAIDRARGASATACLFLQAIVTHQPKSLAEAALISAYLVEQVKGVDEEEYEPLLAFMQNLAGKAVAS